MEQTFFLIDFALCSKLCSLETSLFQPFCCSGTFRRCLRCSWNPMQWSKCLSYFL